MAKGRPSRLLSPELDAAMDLRFKVVSTLVIASPT
jgi:hypothetical protein